MSIKLTPSEDGWEIEYSYEALEHVIAQAKKEGKDSIEKLKELDTALKEKLDSSDIAKTINQKLLLTLIKRVIIDER